MKTQVVIPQIANGYEGLVSDLSKYSEIVFSLPGEALEHFFLESPDIIICFSEPIKDSNGKWKELSEVFNDLKSSVLPNQTLVRLAFMKREDESENYLRLPFGPEELTRYLERLGVLIIE